jgi:hypothetical protein
VAAKITRPDTTYFFLWGLLKGNKPRTIDTLKDMTWQEAAAITDVTLPDVFINLQTCIQKCLGAGGGHFQHML